MYCDGRWDTGVLGEDGEQNVESIRALNPQRLAFISLSTGYKEVGIKGVDKKEQRV